MRLPWNRVNTVLLVLVLLVLVTALAKGAFGGPLDPPAPPSSTMKSLDLIPGSWMRVLDSTNGDVQGCSSSRFACVLGGGAVLDLETGLVWQRDGATTVASWDQAVFECYGHSIGGKWGWRLPTFAELLSLGTGVGPDIVSGSPFTNIARYLGGSLTDYYWSASAQPLAPASAMVVFWNAGSGTAAKSTGLPGYTGRVLCVRGGESMSTD